MIARMVCSGCLVIAVLSAVFAQASGPRVDLSLIVTDKNNKPLSTFRKEDVQVFEDKVEQKIVSIERDERAVNFALVIDASGSLRSLMPSVLEVAAQVITNKQPTDEIFIEAFVTSVRVARVQDFTSDVSALIAALKLIKIEPGQSAVLDGVYVGAGYLVEHNKTPIRRRALVLITDGEDRNSRMRLDEVLKRLRVEDIQVFVIGLTTELEADGGIIGKSPRGKAEKLLTTIAEESGGLVFFPKSKDELLNAANLISDALRAQFHITYQSSNEPTKPEFRKVEVKLSSTSGEKLKATAPRGYYVEAKDVKKQATEPKSP